MHIAVSPLCLDASNAAITRIRPKQATETVDAEKQPGLRCKLCAQLVTFQTLATSPLGRHIHVRTNPAGFEYEFGCFCDAPGCASVGPASAEYTWFPGCKWQVAVCRGCGEHLGWRFSGNERFYALILDKMEAHEDRPL